MRQWMAVYGLSLLLAPACLAQGASPETGNTLFPGGAYVSYNSVFVSRDALPATSTSSMRPTLQHRGLFTFGWGVRRDWQFTAVVPVVTSRRRFFTPGPRTEGGTGLGDILLLAKYRFYRRDSERGTTQASFTIGPKLPTGRTDLRDANGARLAVGLQPGSGSTDVFFGLNYTRTGLFHIKRLVADETFFYVRRSEGSQQMQHGDPLESRFWLSYRPYQSADVKGEWFTGPVVTWQRNRRDRLAGIEQAQSGGDAILLGLTNYISPRPGLVLWLGFDLPVWQTRRGAQTQTDWRISFGVTRQFRIH